jgi:hypothetical protein
VTYFAALSATFLGGNLLCRALFGKPYFEQVYHYHLLKQVKVEGLLDPAAADLVSFVAIGLAICLGLVIAGDIAHNQPSSGTRLRGIIEGRAGRLKVAGLAISLLIGIGLSLGSTPSGLVLLAHNVSLLLGGAEWQKMSYFHAHHSLALLTAGVALTVWAVFSRWSGLKLGNLYLVALTGAACACAATAELSMLRETYTFYYVLLFPGTAMLLGVSWTVIIRLSCAELSPATGFTALLTGLGKLLMPAVAVAVFALYIPDAVSIGQERFTSEHKDAGQLFCYRRIHPTNTVFSDFVRSRFLTPCRLKGNLEPGIFHALWKKSWHLSRAGEIARYIAANSEPDETIIGSSLLTPLLSLLSGREIAAGYVDTNSKRFKSGIDVSDSEVQAACRARASERKMWLAVCATKVRFIVSGPRSFFTPKRMQRHPLVRKFFKPVRLFNEDKVNLSGRYPIMLLRRISDQPQADGSWCSYGSR